MTSAGAAFLTFGRNSSAAYKFSDAGFDVWIGNARGTTYSRRHMTLDPNDPKFWDFSWHEIGVYDIPATIDYILNQTNQTKLSYVTYLQSDLDKNNEIFTIKHFVCGFFFFYFRYVGHSQGVTAMYVTYLPSDFDKNNEFFTIEHFVCFFFSFILGL